MLWLQIVAGSINKDLVDLWTTALLVTLLMLATKCMNADQARRSVDWEVYVTIAFAFGVSTAMEKTKVAATIASGFVTISKCAV